jgi:hypothetical protein
MAINSTSDQGEKLLTTKEAQARVKTAAGCLIFVGLLAVIVPLIAYKLEV